MKVASVMAHWYERVQDMLSAALQVCLLAHTAVDRAPDTCSPVAFPLCAGEGRSWKS